MIEITPEIFDKVDWNTKTITEHCIIYNCTNKSKHYMLFKYFFLSTKRTYWGIASYCHDHKRTSKNNPAGLIEEYQELTTQELFYARLHSFH